MSSASAEPPAGFAQPGPRAPFTIPIGRVTLAPGGFFELLGMERSATTPDPIHTRFGAIPLEDTPAEYLISPSHSRLQLWADTSEIPRVSRDMSKPIS